MHTLSLYGIAGTRTLETQALAATPPQALMERAGLAVAKLALALHNHAERPIWIACGPGNNGGDGLVAARHLHAQGCQVIASLPTRQSAGSVDAHAALLAAQAAGVRITQDLTPPARTALAIDALLGIGATTKPDHSPDQALHQVLRSLNALSARDIATLAVDVPSGLSVETGECLHADAVHATHCLTFLTLKPGLFTGHGPAHCGEIWFDDLGLSGDFSGNVANDIAPINRITPDADADLIGHDSLLNWLRPAHPLSHKGSHGDVWVIGGAPAMRGAARLAARAALAAGAGRVYGSMLGDITVAGDETPEFDSQRPELMRRPVEVTAPGTFLPSLTVVCGCGGGQEIHAVLPAILKGAARLVLDADGLNALGADPALQALLIQRRAVGQNTVLTPHPLEAARLLGTDTHRVQAGRLKAAQELADRLNCHVVLKGAGSVVAAPADTGRKPLINCSGSPALATPGSGDVLAGWLGGLWAQAPAACPQGLAAAAVYWHGLAGESQGLGPLRAADLIERMHGLRSRWGP
ncbi:NAD(P)H-hydrate dehydratase [Roseateles koreensis]|uniref:Bifunctional NAD(P)H-hydrate repair enzyme n=1 Tax=Roseateles koreensis TaxID=2987526 RepID=A0ABT5KLE8_9BURK|nr:NAD(P)H-hydrate dehydratase [Roseateles koreensis]MDC8783672.1 NAD(P)H-hydrate dehydratase [Roseateles koreensis]